MTFFTFLSNLWSILKQAPAIIGIIKAVIDVIGPQQALKFIETFKEALKKEAPTPDSVPKTEPERLRLRRRAEKQLGLDCLQMKKSDYVTYCRFIGINEQEV
ncbi:MAG: hypothetical protein LBT46_02780 [Planctomycetaceae bacterium]|jgi:hypothetical protein|nr:hypothetical protein [Planctomycetaceae bacterium]